MKDKLTDAIRTGIVSSIDPQKCMAKVTFEDRNGTVSRDLFVLVPVTLKDKAYYMPSVGERVRVVFDPEAPSRGYILGSYYADNRQPPVNDENKFHILFEDGTFFEYDKKLHIMTVEIPENGEASISVTTASDINIDTKGNIKVNSEKEIDVTCLGDMNISSNGNIKVKSAKAIDVVCDSEMTLTTNSKLNINALADVAVKTEAGLVIESVGDMRLCSNGQMSLESAGAMTLKGATIDLN